jgi:hypothetical protein
MRAVSGQVSYDQAHPFPLGCPGSKPSGPVKWRIVQEQYHRLAAPLSLLSQTFKIVQHLLGPAWTFKDTESDPVAALRLPFQMPKPDINRFAIYVWFLRPDLPQALGTHLTPDFPLAFSRPKPSASGAGAFSRPLFTRFSSDRNISTSSGSGLPMGTYLVRSASGAAHRLQVSGDGRAVNFKPASQSWGAVQVRSWAKSSRR